MPVFYTAAVEYVESINSLRWFVEMVELDALRTASVLVLLCVILPSVVFISLTVNSGDFGRRKSPQDDKEQDSVRTRMQGRAKERGQ